MQWKSKVCILQERQLEKFEFLVAICNLKAATIIHKKVAPETTRTKEKVIGPVELSNNAHRFKIELPAKANNANNVSTINRIIDRYIIILIIVSIK
jgi:hypothetical protein